MQFESNAELHSRFQEWIKAQDFYPTLLANRGTALFLRDGDEYRYMPLLVGFRVFKGEHNAS